MKIKRTKSPLKRSPFMTNEEFPDEQQNQQPSPNDARPNQNWDMSAVDKSKVMFAVIVAGLILLIMFGVSFCSRTATAPLPEAETIGGADILQRNVDSAFETTDEAVRNDPPESNATSTAAPQPASRPHLTEEEERRMKQTPEERELEDLQHQQQIQQQREELIQQQREAVPSLLPENPPTPAKLGNY